MSQLSEISAVTSGTAPSPGASAHAAKPSQGLTFGDLLDTINPLQHIPIIGSIYRAITGDVMSPTAEVAGGALFGGIVGAVGSLADVVFTQATGKDIGATVLSWLGLDKGFAGKTQLAQAAKTVSSDIPAQTSDPAIAARANDAYRNAISLQDAVPATRSSFGY